MRGRRVDPFPLDAIGKMRVPQSPWAGKKADGQVMQRMRAHPISRQRTWKQNKYSCRLPVTPLWDLFLSMERNEEAARTPREDESYDGNHGQYDTRNRPHQPGGRDGELHKLIRVGTRIARLGHGGHPHPAHNRLQSTLREGGQKPSKNQ